MSSNSSNFAGIEPDDLRRLAEMVEENGLSELRYEQGDLRITLRTAAYFRQNAPTGFPVPIAPFAPHTTTIDDETETFPADLPTAPPAPVGTAVEAPIMGVFYRTPSPDDPPFVEVGDRVEIGQAIGLIEAMKVFSEVKAEFAGTVLKVVAGHRSLVQPGDTLLIVEEEG